ncbi:MAG: hypothetical protein Q4G14_03805 [Paracoccus sp. (in: a-proteobacteria)]|uniref:hypothetical protein n=1 Tax=Paracoccus sp. TaxID=267 RepID=UPI0026DEE5C8|nr:hypothetical protein [Paracoccus sp. (in: a-proteobacteria)]MDO5612352.1 hypothetical protein [Paracoccus sp. (in: a-proteobacteria)]
MTDAPLPSPLKFIGAVLYGMFLGFAPGIFIMLALRSSVQDALLIIAGVIVFALLYHLLGWLLVLGPFYALRWLWHQAIGRQPEPEPESPIRAHWTLIAGFWSGVALTCLMIAYGNLGG